MKKFDIAAFASGVVFALGLGVAQMTNPAKVLAFLDVAGDWDPSLAFVMMGAIAVHVLFVRKAKKAIHPRFAASFEWPPSAAIDGRLLLGAALFGVGWGAAGFCPGPAVVSLAALLPATMAFVAAMLVGMLIHRVTMTR